MAFDTDPYRTLGLDRGATLAEVKRAYRRLAKINHPDAAGEAALPRFLAIQAAYDQIAGPAGRARPGAGGAGPGGAPGAPRRPWSADPGRAGATYRAYGGRAGRSRTAGGPGTRAGSGGSAENHERAGGAGAAAGPGGAGSAGGGRCRGTGPRTGGPGSRRPPETGTRTGTKSGTAGAGPRRPARPPNKATLGSTSYDGAEGEPFEPDWGGASWYGTTSGTYWTLNPKEYADPRKHGPEYQMRGRRRRPAEDPAAEPTAHAAARPTSDRPATDEAAGDGPTPGQPAGEASAGGPARDAPPDPPTHTATSWWEATTARPGSEARRHGPETTDAAGTTRAEAREAAAAAAAAAAARRARSGASPRGTTDAPTPLAADPFLATIRGWLDDPRPSPVARVGRAVLGWVPLALAIGWVAGELSGCARFSADCDPGVAPATWLIQVAALGALIALARAARIAATAAVATVLAVVPGAILLLATSDPAAIAAGRLALGVLMAFAWLVGLSVGSIREARRVRGRGAGRTPQDTPP